MNNPEEKPRVPRQRVLVEVVVAGAVGLLPPILFALPKVPLISDVLIQAANPGMFAGGLAQVIGDGTGLTSAWDVAKLDRLTGAVDVVASVLMFGSAWYVIRTRPKQSQLRLLALACLIVWGGVGVAFGVFRVMLGSS